MILLPSNFEKLFLLSNKGGLCPVISRAICCYSFSLLHKALVTGLTGVSVSYEHLRSGSSFAGWL